MQLTLFLANCTGDRSNCLYPNKTVVTSAEMMKAAVAKDHVCATYKENYRNNDNFLSSDDVVMDCDNDHSDNPNDWITPERFAEMEPDIDFIATPSRHNNIPKEGKAARPKWHAHFPIPEIEDVEEYAKLKEKIHAKYPFFDDQALDAARFLFGAKCDEVFWREGWLSICDVLEGIQISGAEDVDGEDSQTSGTITIQ